MLNYCVRGGGGGILTPVLEPTFERQRRTTLFIYNMFVSVNNCYRLDPPRIDFKETPNQYRTTYDDSEDCCSIHFFHAYPRGLECAKASVTL
jgi:hypothetical protein